MPLIIPDQNIATQVQVPNGMSTLGSMLDMQGKMLNLRKATDTYDADVAQRKAESLSAGSKATVDAANVPQLVRQQAAQTSTAETGAQNAQFKLQGDQAQVGNAIVSGLMADPDVNSGDINKILPKLTDARQQMIARGVPPATAEVLASHAITAATANPQGFPQVLRNLAVQNQPATQQTTTVQPNVMQVDNGQQIVSSSVNPWTLPGTSPAPMSSAQKQLPPNATTMVNGQPQYVGPQPAVAAGQGAPVAAGPAVGQIVAAEGPINTNNAHYNDVVNQGKDAGNRVAQLQAVKEQIPSAYMGHGGPGDVMRSIQRIFGSDAATANDIIQKNIAMLASSGNTDAARTLQEMQTPNAHVTKEAAQEAANALIGVAMRQQKAVDYFAGTPTNSPDYAKKMSQWNANANPRAFEFAAKTPGEQAVMKAQMQKAGTWTTLQKQMISLHNMGVSPE